MHDTVCSIANNETPDKMDKMQYKIARMPQKIYISYLVIAVVVFF